MGQQLKMKLLLTLLVCGFAMMAFAQAEHVTSAKSLSNRKLQRVVVRPSVPRVRVCKKKTGIFCAIGWKTDRTKSYARCCKQITRRLQKIVVKPEARNLGRWKCVKKTKRWCKPGWRVNRRGWFPK